MWTSLGNEAGRSVTSTVGDVTRKAETNASRDVRLLSCRAESDGGDT